MSVYLPRTDEIYFPKTREYFQEVISSYSIGNYRSATVMLYSIAICDILFKLQELKDMYNDTVASEILMEVDKSRSTNDNKSKSKWEKELVDNIYKRTKLLDLEAYTNLNHLYDYRNFSAHPALNENYELITPSKETTVANIKNILEGILIKPPIFIKNIVDTLTEDLKEKKDLYLNEYEKLAVYLNNKYFSRMPASMKLATMKAFWKFCFCLPDDENCSQNLGINRKALEILIEGFPQEAVAHIKENSHLFSVAPDNQCRLNLIMLLSKFPFLFEELDPDVQLQVNAMIDKHNDAKSLAWFRYESTSAHLSYLRSIPNLTLTAVAIERMIVHYSNIGDTGPLIDFFIWYYGNSRSFDSADTRFKCAIEPFLDKMGLSQFEQIIEVTDKNRQIWDRGSAYTANNKIMGYAKHILPEDFDYSNYPHFRFDRGILQPRFGEEVTLDEFAESDNDDLPF